MNVNLYCARDNDDIITFSMLNTINSINIFVFSVGPPIAVGGGTRLVSGYERGLRNICMNVESVASYDKQAYLISCVRVPYVLTKLIAHKHFSKPVAPIVVRNNNETQVWHVFGVCKSRELSSIQRVKGVTVCEGGQEKYIAKEMIALRGNLPAAFLAAIARNAPRVQDVDVMLNMYPNLRVNIDDVSVHGK
ncbi:AC146-like protein [Mythimna sequax nucleopolyhedrovirus]|nr:AC146-like protein [Mythimna sequax nucleopolyhedrovirus]